MRLRLGIILFMNLITFIGYNQVIKEVWQTGNVFRSPESVLYDPISKHIYVSNINGPSDQKDGNGFISLLHENGTIINLHWITGLNAPKGMSIHQNKLYVADIDELVVIDLETHVVEKKYAVPGAVFLNDVTAGKGNAIFISDSRANKIYLFKHGDISLWLEDRQFNRINGLLADKRFLYVGSSVIHQVNIKTKKLRVIQQDCGNIDGLVKDKKGNFIFSNWVGKIFYRKKGQLISLIDLIKEKINTADIDIIKSKNLLLVPTFLDNRVIAYRIE